MFATRAFVALGTQTVADTGISKPGGAGEVCFDAFTHTLRFLKVRLLNKIRMINIVCRLQLKYMRVTQSKFKKTITKCVLN